MKTILISNGLFLLLTLSLHSQNDGSLDETFGIAGKISTLVPGIDFTIHDAKIYGDGSFICVGKSQENIGSDEDIFIAKVKSDGSLDSNFGNNGTITIDIANEDDLGKSIAVQSDGKILITGWTFNGQNFDIVIIRLLSNGSLDNSFATNGKRIINNGSTDTGTKIIALSSGKILVLGRIYTGINSDIFLMRLNQDGSSDSSFGVQGSAITDLTGKNEYVYDAIVLDNGKIVVGGEGEINNNSAFLIAQYNVNGSPDTNFGTNGSSAQPVGISFIGMFRMKKLVDGNYVLVGNAEVGTESEYAAVVFSKDGSVKQSFGNAGSITSNARAGNEYLTTVVSQLDGKIVAGGFVQGSNSIFDFGLIRYNSDGSVDESFADNGFAFVDFNDGTDQLSYIEILNDGKILAIGNSSINGLSYISIARFKNSVLSKTNELGVESFEIYPNPFADKISIKTEKEIENISIYNSTGNLIQVINKSNLIKTSESNYQTSYLENLQSGLYYFSLNYGNKSFVSKIFKL